ncbi:MAG TPA: hypothetical protein PKD78_12140, partial [Saprospiraceae bacterium]|nr:hypothetical protein [Saprospiraceae bacterium]
MFEQDIRLGPGTGTTTSHTLEILIMLFVAGLLGLWLGWVLWSRYKQEAEKMRLDIASLTTTADALRAELAAAKSTLASAQAENANLISQMSSLNRNNANLRDRVAELEEELDVTQSRNRLVETELGLSYSPDTRIADDIPMEVIEQRHEADHAAIYGEDLAEETVLDVATGEALPAAAPEAETELAAPPMLETASAAPVLIPEPVLTAEPASEAAEGFRLESRVPAGSIRLDSSALDTPPAQEPAAEEPQADTLADSAPPVKTRSPK